MIYTLKRADNGEILFKSTIYIDVIDFLCDNPQDVCTTIENTPDAKEE